MGLKLNGRYISLILAVQIAYLVQAVRAAGKCDAVFKGFSDCLLKLGDSMANYPQGLDDKTNIKTVCTYWEDFHSCTVTALTDCQEGAKDMWDKLRKESKNLNIQGSLFELCGSGNGAARVRYNYATSQLFEPQCLRCIIRRVDSVSPTHTHSMLPEIERKSHSFSKDVVILCDIENTHMGLWEILFLSFFFLIFFLFWLSPCVLVAKCYRSVSKASTAKIGPHLKSVFTQK
ncbi:neuritin [Rattus norvegicus]|uniref:Neuritin n=1 Tax=Rattus norvegicus TaxID=10116 RepID=A6J7D1_RAT|nr:neuritin [Rattus norvegicus]